MAIKDQSRNPRWKRALAATAAVATLALSFTGVEASFGGAAQATAEEVPESTAFDCTVPRFFAQAEKPVGTVQVSTGSYTTSGGSEWEPLGGARTGENVFNAMAFNPADGYMCGTFYGQRSGTNVRGSFVRIDRNGDLLPLSESQDPLGAPPNTLWDSGEIDPDTGNVVYTPEKGFTGTDQFDYRICDTSVPAQCHTEAIVVTVTAPIPPAPAGDDTANLSRTGTDGGGTIVAASATVILVLGGAALLLARRRAASARTRTID